MRRYLANVEVRIDFCHYRFFSTKRSPSLSPNRLNRINLRMNLKASSQIQSNQDEVCVFKKKNQEKLDFIGRDDDVLNLLTR